MRFSISYVPVFLLSLLGILGTILVLVGSSFFYRFTVSHALDENKVTIQLLADTIGSPFWIHQELTFIPGTFENFLSQVSKKPAVLFVRMVNTKTGTVEKSSDRREIGIKFDSLPPFGDEIVIQDGMFNDKPVKEFTLKSKSGDNLWMGVSLEKIQKSALLTAILMGEGLLVLFAIAGLGLFFLSRRFVVQPLLSLMEAFEKLENKDYSVRLSNVSGIELQRVFQSFNHMAENLNRFISDLKKGQEVITSERNKLAVTISGITDAVIAVDLDQKIITFNPAAEKMTGFSSKQVLGKPVDKVIKLFDKKEELGVRTYCPLPKEGFEGVAFSKKGLKMAGAKKRESFVDLISGHIKEGIDINLGCILTLHDITKERELEEMKLDFVSMAAHELRTPLTSIRGYADVLINETGDKLDPESKEFLRRLSISAINLDNLIDNLLHVSRIEEGTFKVKMVPCDSVKIIREVMSNFEEQANSKDQTLEFIEPEEKVPPMMVDRFRIAQVLSNLLSNAVSYTKPGGKITILLRKKGKYLAVSVVDTGTGIPREALPKLFTKFFRVSGPLEEGSKGTGLGLFISKSIVEMHKGDIWAESELGKGSTFTFTVPVAKKREIEKYKKAKEKPKLPGGSESVIIMNKESFGA